MQQPLSIAELKSKLKAAALSAGVLSGAAAQAHIRAQLVAKDAAPVSAPSTMQVESINEAARTAIFVMSDATADHVGDRLFPEGAKLADFLRNPQFLWMHDQEVTIGNWKRVWIEGGQLKGEAYFTPPEVDEPGDPAHSFSERCWSLVKAGIVKAVSVFFKINDATFNGDGLDVTDWTLLECSLVTVGMNPNALLNGKTAAQWLEEKAMTEGDAGAGGSMVKAEDLTKCMKDLQDMHGQMAKALGDHARLMASHADLMGKHAKALADAESHAAKLAAVHQDMKTVLDAATAQEPDDDAKKSAAELQARAGALHAEAAKVEKTDAGKAAALAREAAELHAKAAELLKPKAAAPLTAKNFGRLKKAAGHVQAVLADHVASHGVPAEGDGDEDEPKKNAKSDFGSWFASLSPDALKAAAAELAAQELARTRGEIT